jgi:hypothetical protein
MIEKRAGGAMLERRHVSRRTGNSGTGRRITDRKSVSPLPAATPNVGIHENVVLIGSRNAAAAAMARFLKLWAGPRLEVTLVEPDDSADVRFSAGRKASRAAEAFPYDRRRLASRYGVHVMAAKIAAIDPWGRTLTLKDGRRLAYDRLEVAPGAWLAGSQVAITG